MRAALALVVLALAGCAKEAPQRAAAPAPTGILFLAGRHPGTLIRVDTATNTVTTRTNFKGLSGGDPPYMIAFTGGRLVTFALGRASSFAPDLSDPQDLGESWFFVPSATPGRIFNILLTPGSNVTFRGVREVTVDTGHTTFQHHVKVPGWAMGAVDQGLVIQTRRLEIWDPKTAKVVRTLPATFPVAMHGSLVASCNDWVNHPCNAVHLTDTTTGKDRVVKGITWAPGYWGAASRDGRYIAAPAAKGRIGLIDTQTAKATLIPKARMAKIYNRVAWSESGWLFYNAGEGRLGAWRPGERARLLGVKVGKFVDMAAD